MYYLAVGAHLTSTGVSGSPRWIFFLSFFKSPPYTEAQPSWTWLSCHGYGLPASHHSHNSGTLMILGVWRGSRWAVWSLRQCSESLAWHCNGRALAIIWAAQILSSLPNGWFDDCFTYFQRQFGLHAHKGSPLSAHFIWCVCGGGILGSAVWKSL